MLIAVNAQVTIVHQRVLWQINRAAREHIFNIEQIQQRGAQRCGAAHWCNPVVLQLSLRLKPLHVVHILQGNDRVITARVLQVKKPAAVGIKRLAALRIKGGVAPHTAVAAQKCNYRRLKLQHVGSISRQEPANCQRQIHCDEERNRKPTGCAQHAARCMRRPQQAQRQTRECQHTGRLQHPTPGKGEEHAPICKGAICQR